MMQFYKKQQLKHYMHLPSDPGSQKKISCSFHGHRKVKVHFAIGRFTFHVQLPWHTHTQKKKSQSPQALDYYYILKE